jgi:hypothetical protein
MCLAPSRSVSVFCWRFCWQIRQTKKGGTRWRLQPYRHELPRQILAHIDFLFRS